MGCFNKNCVVTGFQITHNDPIVGIKLRESEFSKDFDHISSTWYPIELPVRGVYDDYGRIEVDGKLYEGDEDKDYDSTRCDDYMFIHEWAYDAILNHSTANDDEYENGSHYKSYIREKWEKLEILFLGYTNEKRVENVSLFCMTEMTIRATTGSWFDVYAAHGNREYWLDRILNFENPPTFEKFKEYVQAYIDQLYPLDIYRFELGFQWRPSYVGNQEVDYKLRLALLEKSKEYLTKQMQEYGEEYLD